MRQASPKLIALLDADQFIMADLYTITTIQGIEYRYTNYDVHLTVQGKEFRADGPIISREGISLSLGIEVDNLSIKIETNESTKFGDVPVAQAFHNGVLDGARFKLERIFMDINTPTDTSAGTLVLFEGRIVEPELDRYEINASVVSEVDDLKLQMPRNLYTPGCLNTLFDGACGLSRDNFSVTTSVQAGSTTNRILCNLSQPQGWFTQGVVEFVNTGIKRTVRLHESGALLLTLPLLEVPSVGQTIKVYPGCDKRLDTCDNRFNNRSRFRGAPFVPVPETSV
ncbi:DUF2163 domain-containing protein [Acinetobacter baumannii]|uniref:DUF2163 domain-containing protein n=6 Tax=Acinetobacter baumannii TaxID=470 RepID=A0A8I0K9Y7_ACIBA|nr:DUF2163 domain-containing protein [Acinetobacter baumannii]EMT83225.1 hypothetical protein ABNIH5_19279 [Acinetobacter baumannii ABNIH5]ETY70301.1 hypothetical protein X964_00765 [Acinetobacter baumannii MDR_MMC4]EXD24815.1 phage conserved hypothetical BR0599 family protein [Acinetobacter baumannii 34654]EYU48737.1 phage conserved hypothetical BR0599 family protein [Acinetobacter baumannii 1457504]KCX51334.1 phage conserved hypothetical BR0599 family protein [Acinetobacter baumannii 135867]